MRPLKARRALSLVELMIVAVIVLVFTGTAAAVFIQLIQTSDEVDARLEAVSNARFLLDTLSDDLSQATLSPAIPRANLFLAIHAPLPYGDLFDNDHDGVIDEESPDGQDNDGDWTLANDDRDLQTMFGVFTIQERGYQVPDLGDGHVDEDVVFNSDELTFWIPGASGTNVLRQRLTYRVDTFDGEDNVAIREVFTLYNDGTPPDTEIGPLAFEVLSLNFLMWNFATASPNWVETWDSGAIPGSLPGAPGAVMAEIIIHGASTRLRLPPARALDGVRLSTIVALENVIQSGSFPRALIADGGDFTSDSFGLYTTDPNGPSPSGRGNSPQIREEILQPGQQSGPRSEVRSP